MKTIHASIYDPSSPSFFKSKANDRAKFKYITCSNCDACGLYKNKTCSLVPIIGWSRCPYGKYSEETGPTKRSQTLYKWVEKCKKQVEGVGYLEYPNKKMAIVGDYVYLPYAHMNLNKEVPFLEPGHLFSSGSAFIKVADFTVETINKIIDFHPYALMGGEILSYQHEELPKFMMHLREVIPNLFSNLIATRNDVIERFKLNVVNNVGRKALLKTVPPCTYTTKGSRDGNYRVTWEWDGTTLSTKSPSIYNSSWGEIKGEVLNVTFKPAADAFITVENESQVGPDTVFLD